MARFHKLKVTEITRETPDCVSVVFDVPAALKDEFKYVQGQYLTLKLNVHGEELRRSYSLCTSPVADKELRVAVKKVKDGRGSTLINDSLKVGDEVDVMTPMGNFHTPLSASNKKHYVLFAGGSGITPMLSIIKTVLHSEPGSRLTLIYGNRDDQSIIFKQQLEELNRFYTDRFTLIHVLEHCPPGTDELKQGLLTPDKVKAIMAKFVDLKTDNEYFICGPGPMMQNVKDVLSSMGVDQKRVHIEYFTSVIEAVQAAEKESAGPNVKSKVTVILDGEEKVFDMTTDGIPVLDMALDAGMDVPFACKGAVCCTCRAKVMEGRVKMDQNYALSEGEVEDGYVLTCQAHPITEKVVISYDEP